MAGLLTPDLAERLAGIALGHVAREYPHKLDHVLDGAEDAATPSALHPLFHGSFDWHSNVHSHWLLARLLRRFPALPQAPAIRAHFDQALTPDKVAGEVAYFERPSAAGSSRPYGWAWLLQLSLELDRHDAPWGAALKPLAELLAVRFRSFLPKQTYPIRGGAHFNTAFALTLARDYPSLRDLCDARARDYFLADAGCNAWEPDGDAFLSPALIEAELMRRVLGADFPAWFARFLPSIPDVLLTPATISDRADGKIAHLDGLNLSRAWCWRGLATVLSDVAADAADRHAAAAMSHLTADYAGEHWLATYATLALDGL